ncbi:hypothetical protein MKQ68_19270 [Chitinophaga horti]|uniref:Uncharacterized protein n=1 Tax=Chitinophaga horti TaxID=2920382 RepID=A0ABY6IY55_9BACT|nr:hypothetical protein [Chitinophaga horti]UYQ92230.1 hypothetical protein MKQ68_19270 [Chitinophaga horti]
MFKKLLLLAIISGVLAGVASLAYAKVYAENTAGEFPSVVTTSGIFITCIGGTLLAAIGYWLLHKLLKQRTEPVFNLLFTILSFASLLGPISHRLPLEIEMPELFLGLTVPMHFFPALGWFTLKPLFFKSAPEA